MDYQGPPMRIYQKHSAAIVRIMNWSHFYVDGLDEFHCFISGLMLANHNGLDNQRAIAQCSMPSSVEWRMHQCTLQVATPTYSWSTIWVSARDSFLSLISVVKAYHNEAYTMQYAEPNMSPHEGWVFAPIISSSTAGPGTWAGQGTQCFGHTPPWFCLQKIIQTLLWL